MLGLCLLEIFELDSQFLIVRLELDRSFQISRRFREVLRFLVGLGSQIIRLHGRLVNLQCQSALLDCVFKVSCVVKAKRQVLQAGDLQLLDISIVDFARV